MRGNFLMEHVRDAKWRGLNEKCGKSRAIFPELDLW
jgi:hypothetical protein